MTAPRPELAVRLLGALAVSAAVTLALLWAMQALISTAGQTLSEARRVHFVDFVRVEREEHVTHRRQRPPKPPPPKAPPPPPPQPRLQAPTPGTEPIPVQAVPVSPRIELSATGINLAPAEGEYLPLVKVQPVYPRRALARGIEGYVIVEFTVTRTGSVRDVRVVESNPPGVFDRAAVEAARKFRYKPRVVDGQPIDVPGVRNKITFRIER